MDFVIGVIVRGNDLDDTEDLGYPRSNIKVRNIAAARNHNTDDSKYLKKRDENRSR